MCHLLFTLMSFQTNMHWSYGLLKFIQCFYDALLSFLEPIFIPQKFSCCYKKWYMLGTPCEWVNYLIQMFHLWLRNILRDVRPMTQEIINISIQVKGVVFIRNNWEGWSWMVIFGKSVVPSKRSEAFMMRRPRKIVKEAACATNFRKGPRMIFPN